MTVKKTASLTIRLPEGLHASIEKLAATEEMNVSEWVRAQLRQIVKKEK